MRILFLCHYFPPEVNAPATRTFEHCARWVKAGHEVTVITCAPNCPDGVLYPGYRNTFRRQCETIEGIRVVRVWSYLAPNAGTIRRIANYLSYMVSAVLASIRLARPDVVVATSPQFFCGWAGVFVSRMKRAPLVLEIRDIWPESIRVVGALQNRHLLRLLEWMERRMYRAASHIVAVGRGYRDNIWAKVDVEGRISVVTNGVDLEAYVPEGCNNRYFQTFGLKDQFVCSYVGTIGMAHGLEVVIEAAKQLKRKGRTDICFCLVGNGARLAYLKEKADEAELGNMVVFAGKQPKKDIPAILASSGACLIHLRKHDLFSTVIPSKIFEAMAMSRPLIMGVRGEACDIVLQAKAGLEMEPDSVDSLVEAVETLADRPERREELGRSARAFVGRYYNRDRLADDLLDILSRVVHPERPRSSDLLPMENAKPTYRPDSNPLSDRKSA